MKNYYYDMVEPGDLDQIQYLSTIPQFLEFISNQYSSLTALCEKKAELSYKELIARIKRRISFLDGLGLKKETNIAVLAPNTRNAAELFLAIPSAGFTVMMLPVGLSEKELSGITRKYDIVALFAEKECISKTVGVSCPVYQADSIGDMEAEFEKVQKQTPAAIFLTGGTSGMPKGAVLSHAAVMRGAFNGVFGPGHVLKRRYMAMLPFSHVFGSIRGLLSCLYTGSTVFLYSDLKGAIMEIPIIRPTTLVLVPGMMEIIVGIARLKGREFLGDLRVIISGAAPVSPRLMQECAAFGIKVCPGYGLTECANLTSGNVDADEFPESVGPVYPGQEVKIVDGELYIKGDNVMLGYYNDPEATKKVFSDGWFYTGDLAEFREYKQEKFLVITGRVKNMILLPNGENVSPEELESIFYQNALVKDCLVSQMTINGNLVIGIEILPFMPAFADCTADEMEIRLQSVVDEINTQLPTYKRISKLVVRTEDFKRSRAMKILREQ